MWPPSNLRNTFLFCSSSWQGLQFQTKRLLLLLSRLQLLWMKFLICRLWLQYIYRCLCTFCVLILLFLCLMPCSYQEYKFMVIFISKLLSEQIHFHMHVIMCHGMSVVLIVLWILWNCFGNSFYIFILSLVGRVEPGRQICSNNSVYYWVLCFFPNQCWYSNPALRDWLKEHADTSELNKLKWSYYLINKSPW